MRVQDIIFQHYVDQEKERIITLDKIREKEVVAEEFDLAIVDTEERLRCKLVNGKCSRLLIEQIARHRLNIGEKFADRIEFYNASEILDTIEGLENDNVRHDPFERTAELIGYSKTHHGAFSSIGYSVVRNVRNFWFKHGTSGEIRPEREEEFQEIISEYESNGISAIASAMHSKAMGTRDLKGEWIIFKESNSIKYYLCLASHKEGDLNIFNQKIKKCQIEFPDLIV